MMPSHSDSLRLFRFSGIQVYLHWSWFLVAVFELSARKGRYEFFAWNVAEYLTLFATVLLHEFGHALACRQTGGKAHEIVLWPLGGVAFVSPPQRPGATLWSIAAGPLVNVVLVPVFFGLARLSDALGWTATSPDLARFLIDINVMNLVLLAFNILPVYPLDGGQILRSLLWFGLGRARSLQVASILGLAGVAIGVFLAIFYLGNSPLWTAIMGLFLAQRCWMGLREAKMLTALERLPRHSGVACPSCHIAPPGGPLWLCESCRQRFDPFSTGGVCPHCQTVQATTVCPNCGVDRPLAQWQR